MKRYPLYKPSGIEWLGQFPDNWSFRTIRRITREHRQGYYIAEDYLEEGVKLVRITDLHENGDIDYSEMPYVKITPENEKGYSILEGDFLFPRTGSIGLLGYVKQPERSVFASYLIRFRFKNKEILSDYLYYYFISDVFISGIFSDLHGGVNQNIHAENIKDQCIVFPSDLKEQHSIVRFLDYKTAQIESFIANRQKQIELLKEQKAGIIYKSVIKGINPNAKMKASGIEWIGEIPEHWFICKVRRVLSVLTDFTANGSFADLAKNVNYLDTPDYSRLIRLTDLREDLKNDGIYVNKHAHEFLSKSELFGGEILMANVGAYAGFVCLVPEIDFIATLGPNMILLKFDVKKISNQYAYTLLSSDCYYKLLMNKALSSAQPKLNKEDVKSIDLIFPPTVDEQNKIIEYIKQETSTIDTLISKYQKQIDLMQEYRTSLISQAVTGKIDVRDWKPKIKEYSIEKPENLLVAEE